MILDVLVFALGFMVAGLLALAALPAVWRRALRLTGERLSRLVPLSAEEIAAERDHLRAAHAVALRRLEQKFEGSEADRTALRVEAARREARIAALDETAIRAQVRIAERDAEAAELRREAAGLWAERGAEAQALDGLARLAERRLDEVAALGAERDALRHEVDRNRGSLAGLETRLIGAEARDGDLRRELDEARREVTAAAERLAAERATAERMTAERAAADAAAAAPPSDDGPRKHDERADDERAHEIEGLRAELAFMAEQARSAERRATESAKAYDALRAETPGPGASAGSDERLGAAPARRRDEAALRAAVAALADEVMRAVHAAPASASFDGPPDRAEARG